jgi:hypothetical protein
MKITIKNILILTLLLIGSSCSDSMDELPANNVDVMGTFEIIKGGTLSSQSSTKTIGMVQIIQDNTGKYFIRLSDDFDTKFSTGTVTVYLSTSASLKLNETGSFQLIGIVNMPGEHFYELNEFPDEKFTHGIIWCGAAAIPFGNSRLD